MISAARVVCAVTQRLAQLVRVGARAREQPLAGMGVVGNRRERLIELVGDAGGHLADRRHARDVQQPPVQERERIVAGRCAGSRLWRRPADPVSVHVIPGI
jgi:hypothetical protein